MATSATVAANAVASTKVMPRPQNTTVVAAVPPASANSSSKVRPSTMHFSTLYVCIGVFSGAGKIHHRKHTNVQMAINSTFRIFAHFLLNVCPQIRTRAPCTRASSAECTQAHVWFVYAWNTKLAAIHYIVERDMTILHTVAMLNTMRKHRYLIIIFANIY